MALTRITKGVIKPNENYDTHNINSTGIITAVSANFSGNVTIGGTLTYEDVTSVDVVGVMTATGADINGDLDVDGHTNLDNVSVAGVSTFSGNVKIDAGTNTTLTVEADTAGVALFKATGGSGAQATAALELIQGTTSQQGGGISYNGDGSPAYASGETADHVTFFRMQSGNRTEVFSYPYNSNNVVFNGTVTASTFIGNLSGTVNTATQTNITRVGTLTQLSVSGGTDPVSFTHTGGNCVKFNRSGKTVSINANYAAGNSFSDIGLTSGMDLKFSLGGTHKIVFKSAGHIEPETDSQINLGSTSKRFANVYTDNSDVAGNLTGSNANFTGELTVAEMVGHTGDTHTKLSFPANDTIAFTTGGTERARIDSSGILWMNYGNPVSSSLMILDKDGDGEAAVRFYNAGSNKAKIALDSDEHLTFDVNSAERLRIDSSGRVMIGTTTEGAANADELTISYNNTGVGGGDQGRCGMTIRSGTNTSNAEQDGYIYFSNGTSGDNEYKGTIVYEHDNDALKFGTNGGAERLRISSNGRVGIATNNPKRTLHVLDTVGGGIAVNGASSGIQFGLVDMAGASYNAILSRAGTNDNHITGSTPRDLCLAPEREGAFILGLSPHLGAMTTGVHISRLRNFNIYYAGNFKLNTGDSGSATERLRIDSNGRLIIGGSSAGPYHQDGDEFNIYSAGNTGMSIFSGTSSLGSLFFADDNNDVHGQRRGAIQYNHNGNYLALWTNAGEKLRIDSDGQLLSTCNNNGQVIHKFYNKNDTASSSAMTVEHHFNFNRTSGAMNLSAARIIAGKEREWVGAASNQDGYFAIHTTQNETSAEKLRITSAGKIGIGTDDPKQWVSVNSGRVSIDINADYYGAWIDGDSSGTSSFNVGRWHNAGGRMRSGGSSDNDLVVETQNTAHNLQLQPSGGNVGINETSPDRPLHVSDSSSGGIIRLTNTSTSISNGTICGMVEFEQRDSNTPGVSANIRAEMLDTTNGACNLNFSTGTPNTIGTRMIIQSNGRVNIARKNQATPPAGNGTFSDVGLDTDGGDIATGRIFLQGYQKSADSDFMTGINNEGASLVLYDYSNNHYKQKWHKNGGTELWHSSTQRLETTSSGVRMTGDLQVDGSGTSVTIVPTDGLINFGMDGRSSLVTGTNSCYIFSGSGAGGDMPAGSLVLQARSNVNRHILFATGSTPSLKWQIDGSTGALREYPYNTSTSSQSTGNGQAYHLRRVRNGQVPTMNSGNTYTLFNTNDVGDAGAYIIIIRSFEQNVTGGVLWSIRIVSSVFYLHSGSGNDGETVNIPVTHSGHANNGSNPPVTLKIHLYGGSAHTHGRISITPNGFNYTGSNCDYYVYKLIDV